MSSPTRSRSISVHCFLTLRGVVLGLDRGGDTGVYSTPDQRHGRGSEECAFHLRKSQNGFRWAASVKPEHVGEHAPAAAGTTTDPVCGMDVDPAITFRSHDYSGQRYWCCNLPCLEKFRSAPSQYATPGRLKEATPARAVEYMCPAHPEVRQTGPGKCPKCGMTLERVQPLAPAPAARTECVCPVHPEIVRSEANNCPIRGMALDPIVGGHTMSVHIRCLAVEVGQALSLREAFRPRYSRPKGRLRPERPPHPKPAALVLTPMGDRPTNPKRRSTPKFKSRRAASARRAC